MHATRTPEIVVITGATAGVGRATARRFAQAGAHIALLARGVDGLRATAREVEELGGRALAIETDVADPDQVEHAAQVAEEELGPIDVWINDAMTTVFAPVERVDPDELRRVTDVTYHGTVWGTQAALRRMVPRDRGTIVQVGSALAYRSIPLQSAYCAAKHAARGFTDSLRSELLHDGSRVALTMVHLPGLNTPQFSWCESKMGSQAQPVPPIYQPEVAADAIHWAAHHPRREVFVGWPTIKTVLGAKLAPGFLDRYLARNAWDGQLTGEPPRTRDSNLFEPVAGDHGAHGIFDDRARSRSPVTPVSLRLGATGVQLATVATGAAALGLVALAARRLLR